MANFDTRDPLAAAAVAGLVPETIPAQPTVTHLAQTLAEAAKLFEILEDAYWRLKDLNEQDLATDEDIEDKVDSIISSLDEFFA